MNDSSQQPMLDEKKNASTLIWLANVLLRNRYLIIATPIVLATFAFIATAVFPRPQQAEMTLVPHGSGRSADAGLGGLAAQFGISFGAGGTESPQFYVQLFQTNGLLLDVARSRYPTVTGRQEALHQILEIEAGSDSLRERATVTWLQGHVSARTDAQTGSVTVRVTSPSSQLSVAIARRLLELVSDFNLSRRQSSAAAERRFTEERMAAARSELEASEAALLSFLKNNRSYTQAPELAFIGASLQRQVDLRQGVYQSLAQRYELARIDEVRDTPVFTLIEAPENTVRRAGNSPLLNAILTLVLAVMVAFGGALMIEFYRREKGDRPDAINELRSLWSETTGDLRRVSRRRLARDKAS